jgi:hypothetical protein
MNARITTALALTVSLLTASPMAEAADDAWFTLDKIGEANSYLWREARVHSLKRHGPWVEFEQRWRGVKEGVVEAGPGLKEHMAANCLTGALGVTEYERGEPQVGESRVVRHSLEEIERSNSAVRPLVGVDKELNLQSAIENFACNCREKIAAPNPSVGELRRVYERYYLEQRTIRELRLLYMDVGNEGLARQIIARLDRGESFSTLADKYSRTKDVFSGGDMGFHSEGEWTAENQRLFRSLQVGEYNKAPWKGSEIYKLVEVRKRVPTFDDARPNIIKFTRRAMECGWW